MKVPIWITALASLFLIIVSVLSSKNDQRISVIHDEYSIVRDYPYPNIILMMDYGGFTPDSRRCRLDFQTERHPPFDDDYECDSYSTTEATFYFGSQPVYNTTLPITFVTSYDQDSNISQVSNLLTFSTTNATNAHFQLSIGSDLKVIDKLHFYVTYFNPNMTYIDARHRRTFTFPLVFVTIMCAASIGTFQVRELLLLTMLIAASASASVLNYFAQFATLPLVNVAFFELFVLIFRFHACYTYESGMNEKRVGSTSNIISYSSALLVVTLLEIFFDFYNYYYEDLNLSHSLTKIEKLQMIESVSLFIMFIVFAIMMFTGGSEFEDYDRYCSIGILSIIPEVMAFVSKVVLPFTKFGSTYLPDFIYSSGFYVCAGAIGIVCMDFAGSKRFGNLMDVPARTLDHDNFHDEA